MRNQLKIVYSALTIVAMLGLTSTVHGVPAFARQTGLDCNSCHHQAGWPILNAFGQAFKAGGYTQASEDNLMGDGEALSIPKTLNAAVIFKVRQHFIGTTSTGKVTENTTAVSVTNPGTTLDHTGTTLTQTNETDMPDEWAIWLGGRGGKHVGFAAEVGRSGPEAIGVLGFKVPITFDVGPVKLGAVPYWTDAQGPGWGFENLSTGSVGNIKMFEGGAAQSARMYLDDAGITGMDGKASGLGFYVWHPMGYVYYSAFANEGSNNGAVNGAFAHNIRVAVTPSFAGIDLALGWQFMTGSWGANSDQVPAGAAGDLAPNVTFPGATITGNAIAYRSMVNYMGFDLQVNGTFGIPVMLVGTFGMADNTKLVDNSANFGANGSNKIIGVTAQDGYKAIAWSALVDATVIEDLLNVGVGIRGASFTKYMVDPTDAKKVVVATYTDSAGVVKKYGNLTDNQLIAELKFNIARNLRLSTTGYFSLNKVDVADSKGDITPTVFGSIGGPVTAANADTDPHGASQENKLTVMLMGAF